MKKAPNKSRRRLQNGSQWKWRQQQPADRQTDTTTETKHTRKHTLQQRNTKILWSHWHMEWLECWDGVQLEAKLKKPTQMNERTSEWGDDEGVVAIVGGGVGVELLVVCAAGGGGSWKYGAHFDGEKETEETGIANYSHLRVVWKGVEGGVRQLTDQPTPVQMAHVSLALALDATTTTQQNMKIQKQHRPRDTIKR